jgi:hypothetical protein
LLGWKGHLAQIISYVLRVCLRGWRSSLTTDITRTLVSLRLGQRA